MSSNFQFQRLPSGNEINVLTPTQYDSSYAHAASEYERSPQITASTSRFQYEPVSGGVLRSTGRAEWEDSIVWKSVTFAGHFILTISPVIFLILGFAAVSVHHKPSSHKGQIVLQASKLGPTLFPIVFAAVVGRLFRTYALWRAERGCSVGVLEQLNGSQNMFTAMERAIRIHALGGLSLFVLVLWALSPIGGQSTLRVLYLSQSVFSFDAPIYYFDTSNYTSSYMEGASAMDSGSPTMNAVLEACLLTPDSIAQSPMDLWNNVKIPLMQALPSYSEMSAQDWIMVPQNNSTIYSALTGLIVAGLKTNTTANFTAESSYFNLTCSDPTLFGVNLNTSGDGTVAGFYPEFWAWAGNMTYHNNASTGAFGNPYSSDGSLGSESWSSFMIDTNWNYTDPATRNQTEINMIYASQNTGGETSVIAASNCSVGYSYVETWINCDGLKCYVAKIRQSAQPHSPPSITPWNSGNPVYFSNLLTSFPFAAGVQHDGVTSPIDWYVSGTEDAFVPLTGSLASNYSQVTGEELGQRLGALLNTYWQTSLTLSSIAQPTITNLTMGSPNVFLPIIDATANFTVSTPVYAIDKAWVALVLIISFILLLCGIGGMYFKYAVRVPDILGFVSSLTKDNPYFVGSTGDDSLDGMERARLLRDVPVQLCNVRPWEQRGYFALRSMPRAGGDFHRRDVSSPSTVPTSKFSTQLQSPVVWRD